jgi:hypothetical protein
MTGQQMSNAAAEREAAKKAVANGELKERDTYTAKQVATRCGTDAKTMRKFFRSKHSTVEAVGQGGRYEFDAKDLPKIKREFDAWQKKSQANSTRKAAPTPKPEREAKVNPPTVTEGDDEFTAADINAALEDQHLQELSDMVRDVKGADHEPTPEELEEMERLLNEGDDMMGSDLDLDLDDLDGEEV